MNITRTCKITLNAEELRAALTAYILEKNRYRYDHDAVKSYEEVLSIDTMHPECVTVVWGTTPEPEEVEPPPVAATTAEPAPVSEPTTDEPRLYERGELAPADCRTEHDRTL